MLRAIAFIVRVTVSLALRTAHAGTAPLAARLRAMRGHDWRRLLVAVAAVACVGYLARDSLLPPLLRVLRRAAATLEPLLQHALTTFLVALRALLLQLGRLAAAVSAFLSRNHAMRATLDHITRLARLAWHAVAGWLQWLTALLVQSLNAMA